MGETTRGRGETARRRLGVRSQTTEDRGQKTAGSSAQLSSSFASCGFAVICCNRKGTKNGARLQAPNCQTQVRNQLLLLGSCTTSTRSPSRGLRKLTRSPWTGATAGSSNIRSPGEKGTGFRTSSTAKAMWWRTDLPPRNWTSLDSGSGTTNSIIGNLAEKATAH